jgi:hypothetical protein
MANFRMATITALGKTQYAPPASVWINVDTVTFIVDNEGGGALITLIDGTHLTVKDAPRDLKLPS